MPSTLPIDWTLKTDQIERISCKQACVVAAKLAAGEMNVTTAVVYGKHRPWIEIRANWNAGAYCLAFGLNDEKDQVTNLWFVLTPSGKCFSIDHVQEGDSGKIINPALILTKEQFGLIDKLIPPQSTERKIVVKGYWKVMQELPAGGLAGIGPMMDHGIGGPKGLSFPSELAGFRVEFDDEDAAKKAAQKLREYLADQNAKTQKAKNSEANKKKIAKK
jgi:hypothetical protein